MSKAFESVKEKGGELCFLSSVVRPSANLLSHEPDSSVQTTLCCGVNTKRKNKMNKLMFAATATAALWATVGFADVTSANIVGYMTINSPEANKYKALTVTFEEVTAGETVKVADLMTGAFTGKPAFNDSADQIWLWDTANDVWIQYFFRRTAGSGAADIGWCKKGEQQPTTDTVKNGETIFFRRASSQSVIPLTLSGAVKPFVAQAVYSGIPANKYKFVGYPWPVDMPINDFTKYMTPSPTGKPAFNDSADQIWLWDTANDVWIQYFFRRTAGSGAADIGWCKKGEQVATTDAIPAGEGFFFRRASSQADATITFTYGENTAE